MYKNHDTDTVNSEVPGEPVSDSNNWNIFSDLDNHPEKDSTLDNQHFIKLIEQMDRIASAINDRLSVLEDAVQNIGQRLNDRDLKKMTLKESTVKAMTLSLKIWEKTEKKTKSDLAEESTLWRAYCDGGTYRTRTLDKYLNVSTLPKHPRFDHVIRTAEFVLEKCGLHTPESHELKKLIFHIQNQLDHPLEPETVLS